MTDKKQSPDSMTLYGNLGTIKNKEIKNKTK